MRCIILATLVSAALAGEAAALSCLRPTVQSSFRAADAAEARYVMAVGRLRLLPGETIPRTGEGDPNRRQGYTVAARFDGKLADAGGFSTDASFPVTVRVECAAAWCGGVPLDRMLFFIERREGENLLVEGPCPRFALPATPETIAGAAACLAGEACDPAR